MEKKIMLDQLNDNDHFFYRNKSRLLPTILGGIIGDALGVPVEFKARNMLNIKGMTGFGDLQPAAWNLV